MQNLTVDKILTKPFTKMFASAVFIFSCVANAYDCPNVEPYIDGDPVNTGDVFQWNGHAYRCDVGGWCSIGGAYAPGDGWAWQYAWTDLGNCMTSSFAVNIEHPDSILVGEDFVIELSATNGPPLAWEISGPGVHGPSPVSVTLTSQRGTDVSSYASYITSAIEVPGRYSVVAGFQVGGVGADYLAYVDVIAGGSSSSSSSSTSSSSSSSSSTSSSSTSSSSTSSSSSSGIIICPANIPQWDATTTYVNGATVVVPPGNVCRAKWWTRGENPVHAGEWGAWDCDPCGGSLDY